MTSIRDPHDWVRNGTWVELRTLQGDVYAAGEVFAYCDAPTVEIRTQSGRVVSWRADLARPADRPDTAVTVRLEPDDGRRWRNSPETCGAWELMNRRSDGADDGPNFSSLDALRKQGTLVVT